MMTAFATASTATAAATATATATSRHNDNSDRDDGGIDAAVQVPSSTAATAAEGRSGGVPPAEASPGGDGGYSRLAVPASSPQNFKIGPQPPTAEDGEGRADDDVETCGLTGQEEEASDDTVAEEPLDDCEVEDGGGGDDCDDCEEEDDDQTSYSYESEYEYDYGDSDDSSSSSSSSRCSRDGGLHSHSAQSASLSAAATSASASAAESPALPQSPPPCRHDGGRAIGRGGGGGISILDGLLRKCDELFPEAMGTAGIDAGEYRTFLDLRSGGVGGVEGDDCGKSDGGGGGGKGDGGGGGKGDGKRPPPSDADDASSSSSPSRPPGPPAPASATSRGGGGWDEVAAMVMIQNSTSTSQKTAPPDREDDDAATSPPETTAATSATTTPSGPNRQEGDHHVQRVEGGGEEVEADGRGHGEGAPPSEIDDDFIRALFLGGGGAEWHVHGAQAATAASSGKTPPFLGGVNALATAMGGATSTSAMTVSTTTPMMTTPVMTMATTASSASSSKKKKKRFEPSKLVFRKYHGPSADTELAKQMRTAAEKQREADDQAASILREISTFLLTDGHPDVVDAGIVLLSLKMGRGFNRMIYSCLKNLESFADAGERAGLYLSVLDLVERLADGGGRFLSGFLLHDLLEGDRPRAVATAGGGAGGAGGGGGGSSSCAHLLSALAARAGDARRNQENLIRALMRGGGGGGKKKSGTGGGSGGGASASGGGDGDGENVHCDDVDAEVRTAGDAIAVCDRIEEVDRMVSDAIRNGRSMGILPPPEEVEEVGVGEEEGEEEIVGADDADVDAGDPRGGAAVVDPAGDDRGNMMSEGGGTRPSSPSSSTSPEAKAEARGTAVAVGEAGDDESESHGGSKKSVHHEAAAASPSSRKKSAAAAASASAAAVADSEYCRVMESHRFGSVPIVAHLQTADDRGGELLGGGDETHHFFRQIVKARGGALPPKRLVRIHRELSVLSHDLPVEAGSSIFLRVDEDRPDVMKACVVGPAGTPYENGMFLFDIWLPSDYPNVPPKCQLITTGADRVRFNPNLYKDGKVCLSLLGTWSGPSWIPGTSTLLQVLVSIQSLILVPDPYFNEPGMEPNRDRMEEASDMYNKKIRAATLKVAILQQLRNPPAGFEDCVLDHFRLRRGRLLEQLAEWTESARDKESKKAEVSGDDASPRALAAAKREIPFRCMDGGLRCSPDEVRELCEKIEAGLEGLLEGSDSSVKRDKAA